MFNFGAIMLEFEIDGKFYSCSIDELETSYPFMLIKELAIKHGLPTENIKEHLITIAKKNPV
jgi:hypothetical protein